ncbi:MAG TPA: undecaprenyldiphospho-muramoylpentapeptide beta-N-acetylglucosaminyltransferase [Thermodesulfobacteriota bacterium]|nr:undecaprenyldiphospho-muramoylpentapeptide beta-N-acetylglucosaminyltransferase [Thermodesulfobacteriota bacterium]
MKVIIAGGGTGGHIFPAISVAEEILKRSGTNEVLFAGTKKGLENELLTKRGFRVEHISAQGIKGKGVKKSIAALLSACKGVSDSMAMIKRFRPDVVLGVGGYVSGPMVLAASLRGVPTAICEQNSYPGLTNRILGRFVKKVFATFGESVGFFPRGKVVITGNPVRSDILNAVNPKDGSDSMTILVFGGSQGAHKLNESVPEAISRLGRADIRVIHQTGDRDYETVKDAYAVRGIDARVLRFIDDMARAYGEADFVIGRSGAGTVAEITALGKPSLLVPYPFAANNHQLENARVLERSGAAVIVEDGNARPENLHAALTKLLRKDKLTTMASNARSLGKPDAAARIVDEISRLAGEN